MQQRLGAERPLELTMRREDPGHVNVPPSNVPPSGDVAERLAALAGLRPWWPLVEPTPRWIRVRIADELVADSRRALLHVLYGRGALPRSFLSLSASQIVALPRLASASLLAGALTSAARMLAVALRF